jgi:teichuronic acid biosynthesis glycosyltransferase TuaC
MRRKIRTLVFSTLYPSTVRPGHGIFVETRLKELLNSGEVEAKVVAPVPWFFSSHPRYGAYALMARTPLWEHYNGLDVFHPRYLLPPKVGMTFAPFCLALSCLPVINKLMQDGFRFDLIDAHYYYPDGVAAALLAKYFSKPCVITARGSDVNLISHYLVPRKLIQWAARHANASISVSKALDDVLGDLGVAATKRLVLRNGVDLERFKPTSQLEARMRLGWGTETQLLSVGNLVENKGHHLVIEALKSLPDCRLTVIGSGPELLALKSLGLACGLSGRLDFIGHVPQANLPIYYSAADMLVLASSREGWPNVLLEAMACGTPVVASAVGGIPEIVTRAEAGQLSADRTATAFANAIKALKARYPDRGQVRRYAEQFGWQETTQGQITLFRELTFGGHCIAHGLARPAGSPSSAAPDNK